MRAMPILVGIIVAATPSNVAAETSWVQVARSDDAIYEIDTSRVKRTDNIAGYWLKIKYFSDLKFAFYQLILQEADCANELKRNIRLIIYLNEKDPRIGEGEKTWQPITPDSIGQKVHEFVCTR